jgi:hypothetical protein
LDIQAVLDSDGFVDGHGHFALTRAISLIGKFELLKRLVAPGLPGADFTKSVQVGSDQIVEKGFKFGQRKMALEGFFFPAVQVKLPCSKDWIWCEAARNSWNRVFVLSK